MDNMEGDDGLTSVRDVFEKAIVAAGLHVTEVTLFNNKLDSIIFVCNHHIQHAY